jgi:hypothetical protein
VQHESSCVNKQFAMAKGNQKRTSSSNNEESGGKRKKLELSKSNENERTENEKGDKSTGVTTVIDLQTEDHTGSDGEDNISISNKADDEEDNDEFDDSKSENDGDDDESVEDDANDDETAEQNVSRSGGRQNVNYKESKSDDEEEDEVVLEKDVCYSKVVGIDVEDDGQYENIENSAKHLKVIKDAGDELNEFYELRMIFGK